MKGLDNKGKGLNVKIRQEVKSFVTSKKVRNIAISVLLILASYTGVFLWGYITSTKAGLVNSTTQSEGTEARLQQTSDYSKQIIEGVAGIDEGLNDIELQVVSVQEEVTRSREEVEYVIEINNRITGRARTIENYSNEFIQGSGTINAGFSDIEQTIEQMLRQDQRPRESYIDFNRP